MVRKHQSSTFAWNDILEVLGQELSEGLIKSWFSGVEVLRCDAGGLEIATTSTFAQEWINRRYAGRLRAALQSLGGEPSAQIVVSRREPTPDEAEATAFQQALEGIPAPEIQQPAFESPREVTQARQRSVPRDPGHRLDTFEVGSCNRVAHAAVVSALESGTCGGTPVVIEGPVGTGKTCLLQAAAAAFEEHHPGVPARYLSAEQFLNEYVAALEEGSLTRFRRRMRELGFLAIDDLHCFEGKAKTQDEFRHTFDAIQGRGGVILIATSDPLQELTKLKPDLASRVASGFLVRLEEPDSDTRIAIARAKAAKLGQTLDPEVIEYIARRPHANVRALEGSVTRVIGHAVLSGRSVDLAFARGILEELAPRRERIPRPGVIAEAIGRRLEVSTADLKGRARTRRIAQARQLFMFLARNEGKMSLTEIGRWLGGRDHSTILYGVQRIEERVGKDATIDALLEDLREDLG